MRTKAGLILAAAAAAVLFVGFTLLVKIDTFTNLDFDVTVKLQDHIPHKFSPFFIFLSFLGKFEVMLVVLLIILALRKKIIGFFAVGIFAAAHVVEIVGKVFLHQPPPPFMFYRGRGFFQFGANYVVEDAASYPSGHAMRAIFVGLFILFFTLKSPKLSRFYKILISSGVVILVALIGFSKVVLGEHWPTDIVGGYLVGVIGSSLSLLLVL